MSVDWSTSDGKLAVVEVLRPQTAKGYRRQSVKKRITSNDVSRLPGFRLEDDGHSFDTPRGRCRIDGASPMDEMFSSSLFGLLNISKALRYIDQSGAKPRPVPIDQALRKNISKVEYDHAVIKQMTSERRDEPILMLVAYDGLNVIDGVHRIKRCVRDKIAETTTFILRADALRLMRIRMFHQQVDGMWVQTGGLTDQQMEDQIEVARRYEALIFGGKTQGDRH